ncbi:hypothetical protein ACFS3C_14805 [Azotobacter vinelandii]
MLDAAESLALELGGVRFVTVAAVTERAGLHRTGVRRYYANKEELLLELAERGWGGDGATRSKARLALGKGWSQLKWPRSSLKPSSPFRFFCDLLTHVTLSLEGDVEMERARRYKTNAFAIHDNIVVALVQASRMTTEQIQNLLATTLMLAAGFWQVSHPTPTLARLYEEVPEWAHVALDFGPRLRYLLRAMATGLAGSGSPA